MVISPHYDHITAPISLLPISMQSYGRTDSAARGHLNAYQGTRQTTKSTQQKGGGGLAPYRPIVKNSLPAATTPMYCLRHSIIKCSTKYDTGYATSSSSSTFVLYRLLGFDYKKAPHTAIISGVLEAATSPEYQSPPKQNRFPATQ